jgi:hypothetical protein
MSKITLPTVDYYSLTPFDVDDLYPSFNPFPIKSERIDNFKTLEAWSPISSVIKRTR